MSTYYTAEFDHVVFRTFVTERPDDILQVKEYCSKDIWDLVIRETRTEGSLCFLQDRPAQQRDVVAYTRKRLRKLRSKPIVEGRMANTVGHDYSGKFNGATAGEQQF